MRWTAIVTNGVIAKRHPPFELHRRRSKSFLLAVLDLVGGKWPVAIVVGIWVVVAAGGLLEMDGS